MVPAPSQIAAKPQLSADGAWWWTGKNWIPAKSSDGHWLWTGKAWIATKQIPNPQSPNSAPRVAHLESPFHKSPDGKWWWDGKTWLPILPASAPAVPDPVAALIPHTPRLHTYRIILVVGLAIFIGLTFIAASSGSAAFLIPTVILGAFFVPVVYVVYINEIDAFGGIPTSLLIKIGLVTALFAIPGAVILEKLTGSTTGALVPAFTVGLIEEGCKLIVLLWFVRRTKWRFELDGIIFGAAAGMAFAAFENLAYALVQFLQGGISALLFTLWLRQILGPFGHGTWTASIAAVIWRQKFSGPGRLDRKVLYAYLLSSALHGLWDWVPLPSWGGFAWRLGVGVVSLLVLRHRIREARAQKGRTLSPPPLRQALSP